MERLIELLEDILLELRTLNSTVENIQSDSEQTRNEISGLQRAIGGKLGYNMEDLNKSLREIELRIIEK